MSAFLHSGRSDRQKLGEIKVRFRPEADFLPVHKETPPKRGFLIKILANLIVVMQGTDNPVGFLVP